MAKRPSSKKTLWQKFTTERGFIIFFIVLFISSVAGLIYLNHQSAIDKDREQFMQAKSDLHALYGEIVAEVGRPTAHKSVQSCEYSSSGFATKGYLSCGVYEYMFYKTGDKVEQLDKTKTINNLIRRASHISNIEEDESQDVREYHSLHFSVPTVSNCFAQYLSLVDRDNTFEYPEFINDGGAGLSLMLGCNRSAKAEYFPVISQ